MKFNEKIVMLRKSHGLSQEVLAEKLGVSRQAVSRWEAGDTTPEMGLLRELCRIYDVSADYLLDDDVEKEAEVPVIKEKTDQIEAERKNTKNMILFSAVAFTIAAICALVSTVLADDGIQTALSCFTLIGNTGLAILQYFRYFGK